ncbi:hypothetical protein AC579_8037 [Pseudocercospora musae]|uniref:Uncharacterized protein n=1 Tax=Pseudocercospora musae TaxID=113226 RepID=A0A139IPZ3_9PEZI|nr:hypothetical protein AC579_8037 [Pseudocercospora musae]
MLTPEPLRSIALSSNVPRRWRRSVLDTQECISSYCIHETANSRQGPKTLESSDEANEIAWTDFKLAYQVHLAPAAIPPLSDTRLLSMTARCSSFHHSQAGSNLRFLPFIYPSIFSLAIAIIRTTSAPSRIHTLLQLHLHQHQHHSTP